MKHGLLVAISLAPLGCAGAETVTITPAQPTTPPAEVTVEARPAAVPRATVTPEPAEAAPQPTATASPQQPPQPAEAKKDGSKQRGVLTIIDPNAPWSSGLGNDKDPHAVYGHMWGDEIGDGQGFGLGGLGTLGRGAGTGQGNATKPPQVRMGHVTVAGRLPPEVIQRIVRQNFGRFRLCYENGLRNSPNLQGRVSVRFVIERDGTVSNVGNAGSDIPDAGIVSCVVRSFYGLSFPQPEGGKVAVTYPIMFSPGDSTPAKQASPPAPVKPEPPPTGSSAKPADTTSTKKN